MSMGITQMNSLLSAQSALNEEALAETEDRLQSIGENMASSISDLNERLEADREKIREEEAAKAKEAEKAEKTSDTSKPAKTRKTPETTQTVPADEGADSPNVVATISKAGYNAQAANKPIINPVSVPSAPPEKSPVGSKLDVKV